MDEIMEVAGQAFLAALAAAAIIGLAVFFLFRVDTPVLTMGKYMFQVLDSLLP